MLANAPAIAFIPTANADAALSFFVDKLGLKLVNDDGFALVFDCPGGTMLRVVRVRELTPATYTLFGWQVPDIAAAVRALADNGVAFERFGFMDQDALGIWTAPGGDRIAWFKDPDGNTLSLTQFAD